MSIADDLTRLEQLRDRGSLSPDEFQRAKNKLFSAPGSSEPVLHAINGFRRSGSDRWFGGVCGGLAVATGMQAWIWRLVFLLMVCTGFGLLAYLALWLLVPLEPNLPLLHSS